MRKQSLFLSAAVLLSAATRNPDIPFADHLIDPGASETVAALDVNRDGHLDIISSDNWYEGPRWKKHHLRDINFSSNYVDNFSDLPVDVDGDGFVDVVQFGYFSKNIVWLKNPGKSGGDWKASEIDASGPTEFAFLVDLNNDGKALELLPEFDRPEVPLAWFELAGGKWIKHVVSSKSYGHGIGAGDLNGDGRNDIITPQGWLEAPVDARASGEWTFHTADWDQHAIPASGSAPGAPVPAISRRAHFGRMFVFDVNEDGRPDILTSMAHDYGLCWFENTADGKWTQHVIDNSWSQAHASLIVDLNSDGHPDFVTGKRYMAHNGNDPGERESLGVYWYEYRKAPNNSIEWVRHIISYGGRMGGGMQIAVADVDGDGDLDVISGGKSGVFIAENLAAPARGK
jgi:hypothetical protein